MQYPCFISRKIRTKAIHIEATGTKKAPDAVPGFLSNDSILMNMESFDIIVSEEVIKMMFFPVKHLCFISRASRSRIFQLQDPADGQRRRPDQRGTGNGMRIHITLAKSMISLPFGSMLNRELFV